jgi:DNA-binding NtrC family response regulator
MAPFYNEQSLAAVEREHILKVVAFCQGNRTHAAKLLDISIRGLRIKLRGYEQAGVQVPDRLAFGRPPSKPTRERSILLASSF